MTGVRRIEAIKKYHAFDNLLCNIRSRHAIARLVSALRFLAFREKNPKHGVIHAEPYHAVVLALYAFLAPPIIFLSTMRYGFLSMFIGECALILGSLEVLHCIADR